MTDVSESPQPEVGLPKPSWIQALVRAEPRAPVMGPYLVYLLLLATQDHFPVKLWPVVIAAHTGLTLWVCWYLRDFFPPLGRPHLATALLAGLLAAWGWVAGQHLLDGLKIGTWNVGGYLPFYPGVAKVYNPHEDFGSGGMFWAYASMKILRATTAVPVVEELLWRGFLLQAFVSWDGYDKVPYAKFHWRAFLGTALLSTLQHPANWGVSIGCWLLFNGIFYWRRSLYCMFLTHGITNLALYLYVIRSGDWRFW